MNTGIDWLNRLAKWRTVFAGWQLGTRPKGDPECDAVRDHRELSIILRAEVNTLAHMLIDRGVFTADDYAARLQENARELCELYERRFPGFHSTDEGIVIEQEAVKTTKGWKP